MCAKSLIKTGRSMMMREITSSKTIKFFLRMPFRLRKVLSPRKKKVRKLKGQKSPG